MNPIFRILPALVVGFLAGCKKAPEVRISQTMVESSDESHLVYCGSLDQLDAYRSKERTSRFEDQDKELKATITKLIPERVYRKWFDFRPWHVWDFPNNGQPVLVLFEVDNTRPHPGSSGIRINVFEKSRKVRTESVFWTGHRCYLESVTLNSQENGQDPFIVLETQLGLGSYSQKQIYARIGNRFDLIRIEDSDGKTTRNNYYVKHFACGPAVPHQTEAAWEADLHSDDRTRILRALVWLGGRHWEGKLHDESDRQFEPADQVRLVRNLRANTKVADKLKVLTGSKDRWLSEAAALAAKPEDSR